MDLNGARRKNATRETTSTLKAWLNEHKKNPYPTKGEKIMLAIITKMTLTQVSTWFANARRRLKKENKMTWEPKNKTDDDDDAMLSDEDKDKDDMDHPGHMDKQRDHKGKVNLRFFLFARRVLLVWVGDLVVQKRRSGVFMTPAAAINTSQQRT